MSYRVRNWVRFQHYRDRNPPWIKLHFEMLSSEDWVHLDDSSRVLAVACMLIASRNEGHVPDNPDYVRRVAYLHRKPNFKPLIDCGFLEPASTCKQMQAKDTQETETETETEGEGNAGAATAHKVNGHGKNGKRGALSHFVPDGWKVTEDLYATAVEEGFTRDEIQRETDKFITYEFSKPRSDWNRAWLNWLRKSRESGYAKTR